MGTCWHICKGGTCQRVGHVIIEIWLLYNLWFCFKCHL
jgi:hypothetical protein